MTWASRSLGSLLVIAAWTCLGDFASAEDDSPILVVGSINMDTIIHVGRLPRSGETVSSRFPNSGISVPGGKGANQAVAASRLGKRTVQFVCQFGNDGHAKALEQSLLDNRVDISGCGRTDQPSGQGLVFLLEDGTVSSIVVGGSNAAWPANAQTFESQVRSAIAVMLQREVPEHVNAAVAKAASAAGVPVFQDVGGEDRPISDELLAKLSFVMPNLSELRRLSGLPTETEEQIISAAKALQLRGAKNVLVTRGGAGSLLLTQAGHVLLQGACGVPGGKVLDETGAGDSFRAAFVVAFVEGRPLKECLRFAAAAGATAVSRMGAFPSLPYREESENLECVGPASKDDVDGHAGEGCLKSGGGGAACAARDTKQHADLGVQGPDAGNESSIDAFPMKFASRLNSMSDRTDLWDGEDSVLGWVARQGTVQGLDLVNFNFPQHFSKAGVTLEQAKGALAKSGLKAGAINMRYPSEFRLGAFSNPDEELRRKAIALTIEAGRVAKELGTDELVVWSPYDGYDYSLQADYSTAWTNTVEAFREVCDALPEIKVSLEHKPTDENSRFSIVGSAGAARLLVDSVARPNMGITIDVGHCLMAGENPGQSVAIIAEKLFGVHLNDGHSRIGTEDGLMLGTVHPLMALELMYWLQKVKYSGHLYMDTFPHNEDPVRECEFNIRRAKHIWRRAERLRTAGLDSYLARHDALGALELMERLGHL